MSKNIILGIFSTAEGDRQHPILLPITALSSFASLLAFLTTLHIHPKAHHLNPEHVTLVCETGLTLYEGSDIVDKLLGLWRMDMSVAPKLLIEAVPDDKNLRHCVSKQLVEAYASLRGEYIGVESQVPVGVTPQRAMTHRQARRDDAEDPPYSLDDIGERREFSNAEKGRPNAAGRLQGGKHCSIWINQYDGSRPDNVVLADNAKPTDDHVFEESFEGDLEPGSWSEVGDERSTSTLCDR